MKTLGNIAITIALTLLIVAVVKPDFADTFADRVLGSLEKSSEVLPERISEKIEPYVPDVLISYLHTIRPAPSTTTSSEVSVAALSTNNIIDATNAERLKAGLEPLVLNPKLVQSATVKTNDMITKQYFEHISPTGAGVADLGKQVGYEYVILGENLALGDFVDGNDVVAAWMNSPGHRANILNPNYQEIGVYAGKAIYQGRDVWFAVQHFGTARNACPMINTALKNSIDTINADLKARQAQIANDKASLEAPDRPEGDEYKDRVTEFNKLVAEYNTALVISQEKIKLYNIQVSSFNACLTQYQSK